MRHRRGHPGHAEGQGRWTDSNVTPASDGRPTTLLPKRELFRISLYWLGLSSIFAGLTFILGARLEFDGLVPDKTEAGRTLFLLTIAGALIAVIVQPTIGTISDYTISRWGRRKPYILIGSLLDVVFLAGIAFSADLLAIAAFVALLQFSSNFAQGPFQGYIPDLVPAPQVGFASALVGMMQILGNVAGYLIGAIAVALDQFALGLIALGVLELLTMLSVVDPGPRGYGAQIARRPIVGRDRRARRGARTSSASAASSGSSPRVSPS